MAKISSDQRAALIEILSWIKDPKDKQFITLGGYAGTGKTTLIALLRKNLDKMYKKSKRVAFCSYTGKATRVLSDTLAKAECFYKGDSVSTIHSLIYSPLTNDKEEIIGWTKVEKLGYDLIVVDEASMVDEKIWNDLLSFGKPIVAVGDHGQLPPINGKFNLMEDPEIKLDKIHRQAKGNPIIKASILARKKGKTPDKSESNEIGSYRKLDKTSPDTQTEISEILSSYKPDTLVLCGYNSTRTRLNQFIRESREFSSPEPQKGDRVICLKNNHERQIFNGMLGTIESIETHDKTWYYAEIKMDGENGLYKGFIAIEQFNSNSKIDIKPKKDEVISGDLFDFGYALTVHKAQGSQAPKVILFEERFKQMDDSTWRKWLYTGITRAQKDLVVVR